MEHANGVYSSIILHRRPWNLFRTIQKQDAGDGGFLGSAIFVDMDAWLFDIRAGRDGLPMDILYSGNSLYLSTRTSTSMEHHGNDCIVVDSYSAVEQSHERCAMLAAAADVTCTVRFKVAPLQFAMLYGANNTSDNVPPDQLRMQPSKLCPPAPRRGPERSQRAQEGTQEGSPGARASSRGMKLCPPLPQGPKLHQGE